MNLHSLGEFGLINHLSRTLERRAGVRHGIGDDAAWLEPLRNPIVTCDALVENVHFRREWTAPRLLGRKAMAVNLSDLAASGARPVAAFVALALGPADDLDFVGELYAGMEEMAAQHHFTLAGGDTVKSACTTLCVTLIGETMNGEPVSREGARPGDVLLTTGTLGDSAAGLALLQNGAGSLNEEAANYLLARHLEPTPRLPEIRAALAVKSQGGGRAVRAALDLSDGLAGDARHIAARSNVTIEIEAEALPLSPACREAAKVLKVDPLNWALQGGEDYELLLAVAPDAAAAVAAAIESATGTRVAAAGRCTEAGADAVVLISKNKERAALGGAFTHF